MYSLKKLNSDENGCFIYSDKYKIKQLFLERIKFNKEKIDIKSLEDISNLQIAFGKNVPIDNTSTVLLNGNGQLTMEFIIQRILVDKMGGNFIMLNLLFGTFLKELGIEIKLINASNEMNLLNITNPVHQYYITNVIQINGISYLVDVGLGKLSPYKPIHLSNLQYTTNQVISNLSFRIKSTSTEYIYEYYINKKKENNIVFHFTMSPINIDIILSNYHKYCSSGYNNNLSLFKLFNGGYFCLSNNLLIIKFKRYNDNELKNNDCSNPPLSSIKLSIKNQDHHNQVVKSLFYNDISSKL